MDNFRDNLDPEQRDAYDEAIEEAKREGAKSVPRTGRRTDAVGDLNVKIGAKGAISLYGWAKFPVTIFAPNLITLLSNGDALREYMVANSHKLSWGKGQEFGEDAPSEEFILGLPEETDEDTD